MVGARISGEPREGSSHGSEPAVSVCHSLGGVANPRPKTLVRRSPRLVPNNAPSHRVGHVGCVDRATGQVPEHPAVDRPERGVRSGRHPALLEDPGFRGRLPPRAALGSPHMPMVPKGSSPRCARACELNGEDALVLGEKIEEPTTLRRTHGGTAWTRAWTRWCPRTPTRPMT